MPKLRAVAQYESHHRVCLAGAYLVRLRSVRTPGGLGKPPSLGKGRGCVTGQLDDKVSLGAEMSAADITPTVAWDGLRGYYACASIQDSGQAPSQGSVMIEIIPLMLLVGACLIMVIVIAIILMLK